MANPLLDDSFPMLAYLDGLVEELRQSIPNALTHWEADAIHDARVATRRLKAAMDLVEPIISSSHRKPFQKLLKRLRQRLGPLRDLDVMLKKLDQFSPGHRLETPAQWLRDHLKEERDRQRQKVAGQSPEKSLARLGAWWGIRHELAESSEAVDCLLAESLHLQLDAFSEQADSACRPPEGIDPSEPRPDIHQLRIAGKSLRYTLEMALKQGHKLPPTVLRSFKQMHDAMGWWHDDVVLAEQAMRMSLKKDLPLHDAAMQQHVMSLARSAMKRSARRLDRFKSLWTERGPLLQQAIRNGFPLTRVPGADPALSAQQTDPDPIGLNESPLPATLPPVAPSNEPA